MFADDQVIGASDEMNADNMLWKLIEEYQQWGLNMNMAKTEYLKIGDEAEDAELKLHEVKRCNEFKYLGTIISEEGTTKRDLHNRTQQAKRAVRTLNSLLWSNKIRIKTKRIIYNAIREPILIQLVLAVYKGRQEENRT